MLKFRFAQNMEALGIERVEANSRNDFRIFNNLTLWLSANFNLSTFALGTLAGPVFKLSFFDGLKVIVLFNILGAIPAAIFATLGPKLGLRQMTISRFSFGWNGAKIMALFNAATCIGWSTVNVMVGGQLVKELSGGRVSSAAAIIVLSLVTMIVSLYGYQHVHRYERYAWIPMAFCFLTLFTRYFPEIRVSTWSLHGSVLYSALASFGAAVFGYAAAWSSYAADYNVNQPESTPPGKIFWLTYLGILIPCIFLEALGLALTTVVPFHGKTGGILLAMATEGFGNPGLWMLAFFVLSLVAANVPNDYSLGLSLQLLGEKWQQISRAVWTVLGTIAYVIIALIAGSEFNETLTDFLLLITYWLAPWLTILLLEHFFFRRGEYDVANWNSKAQLPSGWAAIVAMIFGLFGAYLGASQARFVGPVSRLLSGADVGFELGALCSGVAYLILRKSRP